MIARDIDFVGGGDGNLPPVLERDRLERPQASVFVDSLDRLAARDPKRRFSNGMGNYKGSRRRDESLVSACAGRPNSAAL